MGSYESQWEEVQTDEQNTITYQRELFLMNRLLNACKYMHVHSSSCTSKNHIRMFHVGSTISYNPG